MTAAVQTSGQEPDLFAHAPAAQAAPLVVFTGTLHGPAVLSSRACDHGRALPVVVLELHQVGPAHMRVQAQIPFTEDTRHQAEALARRLQPEQTVTLATRANDIRLFLPEAAVFTQPTT